MNVSPEKIKELLSKELPGQASHKRMLPPGRRLFPVSEELTRARKSSVLLLLFIKNEELYVCLIKRPVQMKVHPGQIALPGGRIEKNETALQTALRETEEEVGVPAEKIKILGSLTELYVSVSRFLIHPFVGWLNEEPQFRLNPDEVEKLILFPLSHFKNLNDYTELDTSTGKLEVPCIKHHEEIIWGATAMILSEFCDLLKQDT